MNFKKNIRIQVIVLFLFAISSCANNRAVRILPISGYLNHLQNVVKRDNHFQLKVLGIEPVSKVPIVILQYKSPQKASKKILITAGIHGDEPAGVSSTMKIIDKLAERKGTDFISDANIDFVPWINPWGLLNGKRENSSGIDINRDFTHLRTAEAQIFTRGISQVDYDVVLDLHESSDDNGFMFFAYEGSPPINGAVDGLVDLGFKYSTSRYGSNYNKGIEVIRQPKIGNTPSWSQRAIAINGCDATWVIESSDSQELIEREELHINAVKLVIHEIFLNKDNE